MAEAPGLTVLFATGLAVLVWFTHRDNIRRLAHREELSLSPSPSSNGSEE
jgi:glycerol-3-phosphate acyltransferase PlsY